MALYLFAGSTQHTVCHEIQNALSATGAILYTDNNPPQPPTEIELNITMVEEGGAGDFRVYGTVSDTSGAGIYGVDVTVYQEDGSQATSMSVTTDENGKYSVENLSYGFDTEVHFVKTGYKTVTKDLGVIG